MRSKKHPPYTAVKLALAGKGITYKDVAEVIDSSEVTVMLKLNGDSDFYLSEQRAICEAFDLAPALFYPESCLSDNVAR